VRKYETCAGHDDPDWIARGNPKIQIPNPKSKLKSKTPKSQKHNWPQRHGGSEELGFLCVSASLWPVSVRLGLIWDLGFGVWDLSDLSVQIGALTLKNPLIAASGCFGYGVEYTEAVDLSTLGGVAVKGLFLKPREGHPPERIVETPSGMLNAIGLQGIGVHRFIEEKLPELRQLRATVIVNICGSTLDEYVELARILSDAEGVAALELNISCPNIKEGGITFGCSLHGTFDVVSAVKKVTALPVIPKLTPNVTDVASFARASEDAGADAVSLVNTFLAMAIDVETRRPELSNIVGGLSGPAIRPIAVRMVYECRRAVKIPVVGMGGIASARDALEFIVAGAHAVQVGTANFVDPFIWKKLLDGITDYMRRHNISRISDLVGTIDTTSREKEWISS
jgi:dihydroorotate dehydrogenase (NAD+) catalytic subunit